MNRAFDYRHYTEWRDPNELIPYALNAKQHDEKQVRNIANSIRRGEIVLDLFAGSGSTLIAAEQLERKCCMMELDARYADSILDRWETFTGGKAVLISE
jgi:DNA modification methylase